MKTCFINTNTPKVEENIEEQYEQLDSLISKAVSMVTPVWPLKKAIAVNPLLAYQHLNFFEALERNQSIFYSPLQCPLTKEKVKEVNLELIKWLKSFLDDEISTLKMPYKNEGFFRAWLKLIKYDRTIKKNEANYKWLEKIPESSHEALLFALKHLELSPECWGNYFLFSLSTLPGFCGYIKWKNDWQKDLSITFKDFIAVKANLDLLLNTSPSNEFLNTLNKIKPFSSKFDRQKIEESERQYKQKIICELKEEKTILSKPKLIEAQLVFCIDTRSEPLRRKLENKGFETFGFAGFFGLPININCKHSSHKFDACPVILKPSFNITRTVECNTKIQSATFKLKEHLKKSSKKGFKDLKYNFATAFTLAESSGLFCGIWMAIKTLLPVTSKKLRTFLENKKGLITKSKYCIDDIPLENQIEMAYNNLKMFGFTSNFSPLVVFVGHKSTSENNAHASGLDCGACGANPGSSNALILAQILNRSAVRQALKIKGIEIADTTTFIGATHNTALDDIEFHCSESLNASSLKSLELLKNTMHEINASNPSLKNKLKASSDWSVTRPEWGLARNASFIIAKRDFSKHVNLDARSFLHSYDYKEDQNFEYLKQIMLGPLMVANWINTQYFFSTYDNISYGSLSKLTHNIVGNFGVMQGNLSDLMHGMTFESLYEDDNKPYHEPLRLLTIIEAPKEAVIDVINSNLTLKELVKNQWLNIVLFDASDNNPYNVNKDIKLELIKI
jgi:uncharacterized protein YbcC (UPF0753/DUF2309 family)